MIAKEHKDAGVKLYMNNGVKEIVKNNYNSVTAVILNDGTTIPVNMVIVGTGIAPATKFLAREETGIKLDS